MSQEPASSAERNFGAFRGCLVEGDPVQRARERRVRRKAMAISTLLQAAALAAIILVPLIWSANRLALAMGAPPPIYLSGGGGSHPTAAPPRPANTLPHPACSFCAPRDIPPRIPTGGSNTNRTDPNSTDQPPGIGPGVGPSIPGGLWPTGDRLPTFQPPQPPTTTVQSPRVVQITHLDLAMLVYRVEPVFPALARQIRRSGRVELHAVIATDGSIQSLQAVAGDPLFFQSAMDAVRQWRYRATVLNGRLVEVDTYITVIYQLQ